MGVAGAAGLVVAARAAAVSAQRVQLGHVRSLGHLGVHVLLALALLLLAPLLLGLVPRLLLEHGAVAGGVLLLRLGQRPLVALTAGPAHQLAAVLILKIFYVSNNQP